MNSSVNFQNKTYYYEYDGETILSITDEEGAIVDNVLINTIAQLDLKLYYKELYLEVEV
jgi:hypothetical protein